MIASNILSMKNNLENIYSALSSVGAQIPSQRNIQNLFSAINSIQRGSNLYYNLINDGTVRKITDAQVGELSEINNLAGLSQLTTVSLNSCKTIGSHCFYFCYNLQNVSIPLCETILSRAFMSCYSLTGISFPVCNHIDYSAFMNCFSLQTLSLPQVKKISPNAFTSCNLSEVYLPNCQSLYTQTFGDNYNLKMVSLPAIQYISGACFVRCSSLSIVNLTGISAVPAVSGTILNYTPIENSSYLGYFGSIYVPSSLYAAFLTATGWSQYSARITSAPAPS